MTLSQARIETETLLKRVDHGDAMAVYSESVPVEFENDRLKSIEDVSRYSLGLRLWQNGRAGNSYTTQPGASDDLLTRAAQSAMLGEELQFDLPGPSQLPALVQESPETPAVTKEEMVTLGENLLNDLKQIDNRAQVNVTVARSQSWRHLANTAGFQGSYSETRFSVSAGLQLVEDNGSLLHVSEGDSSISPAVDLDKIRHEIEFRYRHAQKQEKVRTGYLPVIFTPDALDLLLEPLEIAANGKTLYKGISLLAGREGEEIASPLLSFDDDPFYPGAAASYPFDDEGVVPQKRAVLKDGHFGGFIYDLATAKRLNTRSTGHGGRSTAGMPSPGFSNWVFKPGQDKLEDMIAAMDYGLLVYEFLGGGMSNVLAGEISVNVELGYLVKKGKVLGRVKDTMISGNAFEWLKNVSRVENRIHRNGSLYAPHIQVEKVSVTGE